MKKVIKIMMPYLGDCKRMAIEFGCTPQTVSNALNFKTPYSELAAKIRRYALEHGGIEVKK